MKIKERIILKLYSSYPTAAAVSRGWAANKSLISDLPWLDRNAVSALWSIPNSSGESTAGKLSTYSQQTDKEISAGGGRYTCQFLKVED